MSITVLTGGRIEARTEAARGRFGTHADAEILASHLDHRLPRTGRRYDQPAALGALLHFDARLDTHHADRFTEPEDLWDQ